MLRKDRKLQVLLDQPVGLDAHRILRPSRGYQISAYIMLMPSNLHPFSGRTPIRSADVEGRATPADCITEEEAFVRVGLLIEETGISLLPMVGVGNLEAKIKLPEVWNPGKVKARIVHGAGRVHHRVYIVFAEEIAVHGQPLAQMRETIREIYATLALSGIILGIYNAENVTDAEIGGEEVAEGERNALAESLRRAGDPNTPNLGWA